MAVLDPGATAREDVERLHGAPELQPEIAGIRIGGYAYDVASGRITVAADPT